MRVTENPSSKHSFYLSKSNKTFCALENSLIPDPKSPTGFFARQYSATIDDENALRFGQGFESLRLFTWIIRAGEERASSVKDGTKLFAGDAIIMDRDGQLKHDLSEAFVCPSSENCVVKRREFYFEHAAYRRYIFFAIVEEDEDNVGPLQRVEK